MISNSTEGREVRKFGLIALAFFGSLCSLGIWFKRPVPTYLFGSLAFLGFCFVLFPSPLRPIHAGWLKIAHFMGRVITILILSLAYYLVITPSALIKRAFGGRPLPMRLDKDAESYWVKRDEPAQSKDRFLKRY